MARGLAAGLAPVVVVVVVVVEEAFDEALSCLVTLTIRVSLPARPAGYRGR